MKAKNRKWVKKLTINERYRAISIHRTKRYNLIYAIILILFLMIPTTFSRYTTTAEGETSVNIANWQISINGVDLTQNATLNDKIDLVYGNQHNGMILPGETGYFDIILDPTGTEVSVEYEIVIDLSNMPQNMILTGYTLNVGEMMNVPNNNTFTGEIRLSNQSQLDNSNKQTYRIYWQWTGSSEIQIDENYFINACTRVRQLI